MTWDQYLRKLRWNMSYLQEVQDPQRAVAACARLMQERFPGPYVLTYAYEKGRLEIHPYFQDPDEEVMWHLRFG